MSTSASPTGNGERDGPDRLVANHGTTSLLQWVWGSYFRTALIPLLVVEVAFIIIYLAATHLATQENLAAVRAIATGAFQFYKGH